MRILFIGDVMGRSGREALGKYLPELKENLHPDAVIVNGENAAHGIGITGKICKQFFDLGADCITSGNHIWDQREIIPYIDKEPRLLRPLNYPKGTIGNGYFRLTLTSGQVILIINAMGRLFMETLDDPFTLLDDLVNQERLGDSAHAIFLDFHAETTSEKMAMAHFLDGRISAIVGTHTHVPTADTHILPRGTGYQTDAGMTGDYNSVIGVVPDVPIHRFVKKTPSEKMQPATGEGTICGTFIETDDQTGLCREIKPIIKGALLQER